MRYSTYLEVDLSLLGKNIDNIKSLTTGQLIPMVKANAYGNGLVSVARFLVQECGIKKLGCATLGEAIFLLRECPDLEAEVLIFSDSEVMNPSFHRTYLDFNITPVIFSFEELNFFLNQPQFEKTPLILKINTGMNRLGLSIEDLQRLLPKIKNRSVKHLMTHFACSYFPQKEGDKTQRQLEEFHQVKSWLQGEGVEIQETSVSNSGAIEQKIGCAETYVRPGLMIYGPYSVSQDHWRGQHISRLVTKILHLFEVKKGTPLGYGAPVSPGNAIVAIIALGYADLSVTTLSGASVMVNGYEAKIFGRVNMDMIFLMFSLDVAGKIKAGDSVEIWNHNNQVICSLSEQMKTIPYHLMCGVSARVPRIYKE